MDIEQINIHSLPSLKIPERYNLPEIGAVYFVLSETGDVEYIGKAKNLRKRWRAHECCMNLDSPKTCRVAWLEIVGEDKQFEFEKQLIRKFNPKNNAAYIVKPPKPKPVFTATNECILFNNMTGKEFKIQRVTMDFTQAELGEKLDISANTVSRYETEDLKIPKVVELAMKQLASELTGKQAPLMEKRDAAMRKLRGEE